MFLLACLWHLIINIFYGLYSHCDGLAVVSLPGIHSTQIIQTSGARLLHVTKIDIKYTITTPLANQDISLKETDMT